MDDYGYFDRLILKYLFLDVLWLQKTLNNNPPRTVKTSFDKIDWQTYHTRIHILHLRQPWMAIVPSKHSKIETQSMARQNMINEPVGWNSGRTMNMESNMEQTIERQGKKINK